jgi:hypothetical protein
MKSFKDFAIIPKIENFVGDKIATNKVLDKDIIVKDYRVKPSKFEGKGDRVDIQIEYKDEDRVIFTGAKYLIQTILQIPKTNFPFKTKIIKVGEHYEFS